MFRVGQKVVCVDSTTSLPGFVCGHGLVWATDDDIPVVGEIYTIARIFIILNQVAFELIEIRRGTAVREQWGVVGYGAFRFRPIIARKTDIAIFTEMLNPHKIREDVG